MRNKLFEEFDIQLLDIKSDVKEYEFQINETFFKEFDQDLIEKGNLKIEAAVSKTHSMVTIEIYMQGLLEYICDRSLKKFDEPFKLETTLYFKYGEESKELDVNLYQIEDNTIVLNIANYLMECILVEIPIKKIHPDHRGEQDSEDPFYQTTIEGENKEEKVDPRWAALKKLKGNK